MFWLINKKLIFNDKLKSRGLKGVYVNPKIFANSVKTFLQR